MGKIKKTPTKKDQILALYMAGAHSIGELASLTNSRPSYVAAVLRDTQALQGYFDLYTTTSEPMNIYSKFFAERLGFKTERIAQRSVHYIDRLYQHFAHVSDRSGQHHALVMALTMFNRARWSKKMTEADIFRQWLLRKIQEEDEVPKPVPRLSGHTRTREHMRGGEFI